MTPISEPIGRGKSSSSRSITASISSSCSSDNLKPSEPKNLIPLSSSGLCDAEIIIPTSAFITLVRYATPGVDITPNRITSVPIDKDRKSTRLNSSHVAISYAVFCLKKKTVNNVGHIDLSAQGKGTRHDSAVASPAPHSLSNYIPPLLSVSLSHATATPEIYPLSLHDALPIYCVTQKS